MSQHDAPHRDERLRAIVELVESSERPVTVEWLAEELAVSAATVRRDTVVLERQGVVARSWGRVGRPGGFVEQPIGQRASQHAAEKRRIAQAAAKLVPDEALVGLTGGTTTLAVARAIAGRRKLTVVTNSLSVGMQLTHRSNIRLILSGGEARTASFELSGPLAESAIGAFNLDLAIVGVDGVDVRAGCTTYDHAEASTNAALVQRATRTLVVADASKLGRAGFARVCDVSDISMIITDRAATDAQVAEFIEAGVAVQRV
jgi:DeoR family transcriptional regulator of aga operon